MNYLTDHEMWEALLGMSSDNGLKNLIIDRLCSHLVDTNKPPTEVCPKSDPKQQTLILVDRRIKYIFSHFSASFRSLMQAPMPHLRTRIL